MTLKDLLHGESMIKYIEKFVKKIWKLKKKVVFHENTRK
jgi:hypothetical protein